MVFVGRTSLSPPLGVLGVIEGFYGRPWTAEQRLRLFGQMAGWGMNTYLYAPKDDLRHRARWRERYPAPEAAALASLAAAARPHAVQFVYALAPGLDLRWADLGDRQALVDKLVSVAELGVTDFALLFDDIPPHTDRAAQAAEQVQAAHLVLRTLVSLGLEERLLLCPTEYCGEFAVPSVRASPYLRTLGEQLDQRVAVFWTGPKIVSPKIDVASIREVAHVLRRRPLLWDNLHASDYTSHRLHLGPYAGRPLELRQELCGILTNPNTPFEVNFPALAGLADYAAARPGWTATASGRKTLEAWLPEFNSAAPGPGGAATLSDLALLADALFLPHRLGARARALLDAAQAFAASPQDPSLRRKVASGRDRFRRILTALETGHNRDLLYDLHPYLVDILEELSRLLEWAQHPESDRYPYRGGLGDRLLTLGWSRKL